MQSTAYGASLSGGAFDFESFIKQPQTIVRLLSWLFSIVVFATITAEGYINSSVKAEIKCVFNENDSACSYGVGIGILAFLACIAFLFLDAYLPRMSNANERKYIVMADLIFSGVWTFLWFICFCVLASQWSKTTIGIPGDAPRAIVAFSFFSIISWAVLFYFAFGRYRQGIREFDQEYRDPANDHNTPYPPAQFAGSSGPAGYQQSPFSGHSESTGEYQPPAY